MNIRLYCEADFVEWQRMRTALWPDQSLEDMGSWLARPDAAVWVAERGTQGLCGFAEVGERAWAEGCRTAPVAYLEGWWVDADVRRLGIGSALIQEVERWARQRGYRELASDTGLDNDASQRAHQRLGFVEVDRAILYAKQL